MTTKIVIEATKGSAKIEYDTASDGEGFTGLGRVEKGESAVRWLAGDGEELRITATGGEVIVAVGADDNVTAKIRNDKGKITKTIKVPHEETSQVTLADSESVTLK
jgi:hypothetical protein